MAKHLKVEPKLMAEFQARYFQAFPEIGGPHAGPTWHKYVAQQLQLHGHLTTLLGRTRHFFGRHNDDSTLREAIAFEPQSVVGDLLNLGAWRIWRHGRDRNIRLLAQLHDAVLIDFPDDPTLEQYIKAEVSAKLRTELHVQGETFTIPNDFSSGWNWGKGGAGNPHGVRKLGQGREDRKAPSLRGLDRVIPSFHE
jgi:DNA polymerase I-like protein with 3'-5' exonuclease and polymerase domains